jgi:hypothetical protein
MATGSMMTGSLASEKPRLASPSLFDEAAEAMRGQIDRFDPVTGIEGWAIDLSDPSKILTVELLIDEVIVARTQTDHVRQDIAEALGAEDVCAGFVFPEDLADIIYDLAKGGVRGSLRIRIAETPYLLPSMVPPPEVEVLTWGLRGLRTEGYRGFDMIARLCDLRTQTTDLLRHPLRPLPENSLGFIESLTIDAAGLVWIGGWMKRSITVDQPVVIVDRQKISGAIALTMFEREDLGSDAYGIIGVLQSDWRPTASSELFIYLADGKSFLESLRPLNIVSKKSFVEHFAHRWATCHTGHSSTLHYLLDHPDSWEPTDGGAGAQVRAALEEVLILPSFGCVVTGWALSPLKAIESFGLRFGSTILRCDENSIAFRARPDLEAVTPGCHRLTGQAGFVAVFRGTIPPRDIGNPALKVLLADGSATNHTIDMNVVRRLGHATSTDHILSFYPSLKSESFFRDFAAAVRQDARSQAEVCRPFRIAPSTGAIVVGVPEERSDAFLLFDWIDRHVSRRRKGPGLVFVAGRGIARTAVVSRFDQLASRTNLPCSLFFTDDPAGCSYALPTILRDIGADRFTFFAAGLIPTDEGWTAARALEDGLTLMRVADAASPGLDGRTSLQCFGWNRESLTEWLQTAPSFLGGLAEDAARLLEGDAARIVEDGAMFLRPNSSTPLERAINDIAMVA